ncbi:MAG: diaminopimelate epimerase [Bacteroidota bacterium]
MELISFFKYQGTGNDFVIIDNRSLFFDKNQAQVIQRICDRRFGIGADGFILIENSPEQDFRMVYFNADGYEGSLCGNGGRCAVKFAQKLGLFDTETRFMAYDGPHEARVDERGWVHLHMANVGQVSSMGEGYFLDTGSPHYVEVVEQLKQFDVLGKGAALRYDARFELKGGTNVNFIEADASEACLHVRTYERGVENETLSCGTGVTASALVSGLASPVQIHTLGGTLAVSFEKTKDGTFQQIVLSGPAQEVFEGRFPLTK